MECGLETVARTSISTCAHPVTTSCIKKEMRFELGGPETNPRRLGKVSHPSSGLKMEGFPYHYLRWSPLLLSWQKNGVTGHRFLIKGVIPGKLLSSQTLSPQSEECNQDGEWNTLGLPSWRRRWAPLYMNWVQCLFFLRHFCVFQGEDHAALGHSLNFPWGARRCPLHFLLNKLYF